MWAELAFLVMAANSKGSSKLKKGDHVKALKNVFSMDIKKYDVFIVSLNQINIYLLL